MLLEAWLTSSFHFIWDYGVYNVYLEKKTQRKAELLLIEVIQIKKKLHRWWVNSSVWYQAAMTLNAAADSDTSSVSVWHAALSSHSFLSAHSLTTVTIFLRLLSQWALTSGTASCSVHNTALGDQFDRKTGVCMFDIRHFVFLNSTIK